MYAWNTVGAIVGSLAAGFLLIPALRYEGAIRVAVYASAALGIAALWMLLPREVASLAIARIRARRRRVRVFMPAGAHDSCW